LPFVKWTLRAAASIILIISTWFAYQYATTNSSQLYSEIYEEYNPNTDRGIGTLHTHDMVNQFKAGNFTAVINTYSNLTTSNNREKFMAGYAFMKNGDNKNAVTLFNQILDYNKQSQSRLYNDEAEFYTGLCLLQLKKNQDALIIFTTIRDNPDHTFYTKVSKWTITRLKWLK
jgi:TolA-binding protein